MCVLCTLDLLQLICVLNCTVLCRMFSFLKWREYARAHTAHTHTRSSARTIYPHYIRSSLFWANELKENEQNDIKREIESVFALLRKKIRAQMRLMLVCESFWQWEQQNYRDQTRITKIRSKWFRNRNNFNKAKNKLSLGPGTNISMNHSKQQLEMMTNHA